MASTNTLAMTVGSEVVSDGHLNTIWSVCLLDRCPVETRIVYQINPGMYMSFFFFTLRHSPTKNKKKILSHVNC